MKPTYRRPYVSLLACKPSHLYMQKCSVLKAQLQLHLDTDVFVIVTHLLFMSALKPLSINPSAQALRTMMTVTHSTCSHIACEVPPTSAWQHLLVIRSDHARRINRSQFAAAATPQYSAVSIGACFKRPADNTRASASVRSSQLDRVSRLEI